MEIQAYAELALAIIGVASTLATLTNNKSANKYIKAILSFINIVGMNVGRAKNDPGSK